MGYLDDAVAEGQPSEPTDPFAPQKTRARPWFDLEDVVTAVPRGIAGAAKGAWNLADTLTGDALPDWNRNPFGESKSTIGGIVEGAAHFTAGFIPFGGGLGFAGLLGKAAVGASRLAKVGRLAAASGLAGFTAFEGHEARLSDLVERNPSLSNPLTEFLASNGEDPELLGRLKNALEQAGMGAATEALILGVKAVIKGKSAKADVLAKGGTDEAAAEAADAAATEVAPPEKMIQLVRDAEGLSIDDPLGATGVHELPTSMQMRRNKGPAFTPEEHAAFSAEAKAKYPDLPQHKAEAQLALDSARENAARADRGDRRVVEEGQPPEGQPERRAPKPAPEAPSNTPEAPSSPPEAPKGPPVEGVDATPEQARRAPLLRRLGLNDDGMKKVNAFIDAYEKKGQAIEDVVGPGAGLPGETAFNPRKLSAVERAHLGLLEADLPMQNFRSPDANNVFIRTAEEFFRAEAQADFKSLAPTTIAKITDDAIAANADMLGHKDLVAYRAAVQVRAGRTINALEDALPMVVADKFALQSSSRAAIKSMRDLRQILNREVAGGATSLDRAAVEFGEAVQHMTAMRAAVDNKKALAGRLLRAEGITVGEVQVPRELMKLAEDPVLLQQTLQSRGGVDRVVKMMEKFEKAAAIAGPEGADAALHKLSTATVGSKLLDMTTEFFMGSVLSSPQTWVINGTSNALMQVFAPLERALGSLMIRGSNGKLAPASGLALQQPILQESLAQLTYTKSSLLDAVRMFKESGFDPDSAVSGAGIFEGGRHAPAITPENLGLNPETFQGAAVGWIGKGARASLRILGGTDVVAKNTVYRASAQARLQTEALQAGLKDTGQIAKHVAKRLERLIGDGQAYTQKSVLQRAVKNAEAAGLKDPEGIQKYVLDYYKGPDGFDPTLGALSAELVNEANIATFTNKAAPGTVTAAVQNFIAQIPVLKLVAPFVNTPANLMKAAGQRADVPSAVRYWLGRQWPAMMPEMKETSSRFLQDMLSKDPRRAADAVGRISVGASAAVFFTHEALSGNITGHGPADPQERQALMDTGWQPYSFKVGDSYISYARLDPLATFVGTAADMAEYMDRQEDVNDEDYMTSIYGLAIGMANNFTNKSYLTGFANLIGAMQAPEEKLPVFVRRQAGAFVPNILGTAGYGVGQDPNLREVHSFIDTLRSKVPGLSSKLPPRRNILGEPLERPMALEGTNVAAHTLVGFIDPIKYSRVKDDVVRNELAALGHSWEPPKRRTNGLDLMDVPHGETNAYDRWQALQGSVNIGGQNLKAALRREIKSPTYRKLTPVSVDGLVSPRVGRISSIISDYRSAAWKQLLREVPALKNHDRAFTANKHRLRAGLPAAIIPGL